MIVGEAADIRRSDERGRVVAALADAGEPLHVSEIVSLAKLVTRNAADNLLMRMTNDGDIERIKRGVYGLPGHARKNMREVRDKERSEPKPLKEEQDSGRSHNLTHLTHVFERKDPEPPAGAAPTRHYLGPPGYDPADFPDIPDFLRRV
jgi:hypothetical protein